MNRHEVLVYRIIYFIYLKHHIIIEGARPEGVSRMSEKRFRVVCNGVQQDRVFTAKELGEVIGAWADEVGGSLEFKVSEFVPPKQSSDFQVGVEYYARSLCDHNCIFRIKVKKRTEKSIWFDSDMGRGYADRRCAVKKDSDGVEYVMPERYSFAPVFRASRIADGVHDLPDWA